MTEEEKLKNFVIRFFHILESKVTEDNSILKIENIPEKFKKFYGKSEPYFFYFNETNKINNGEYISKGSYLLSCINKFLENKGKTTLLKINITKEPKKLIKEKFSIRNCKISGIYSKNNYKNLERFSFLTTFQYLNKKEEKITKIFIEEGKEIKFDLSKYHIEEGKKRELNFNDFQKDYELSKKILRKNIEEKIISIQKNLSKELEKEKIRINNHYKEQIKDDEEKIRQLKKQLNDIKKTENKKRNQKIEEQIKEITSKERETYLEKDKNSSIDQEIQKHSLNIKNKLLNTTIIYYPIIELQVYLKTPNNSKRLIYFEYDSFKEKFSEIKCDFCKKEIEEIILCSTGHLICRECGDFCENCREIICKKCSVINCSDCGKTICKKCSEKCNICGKTKCNSHFIKDSFDKKEICRECSEKCWECGTLSNPKNIRKTKEGRELCQKCFQKEIKKNILNDLNKY